MTTKLPFAGALKDAVLAALVAFGLFSLMIGLHTDQGPTGALVISTRFKELGIVVGLVFAGALLRALIFGRGPVPFAKLVPEGWGDRAQSFGKFAAPLLLGAAIIWPIAFYQN